MRNVRGVAGIGITAAAVLALAACSSNDTASSGSSSSAPAPASSSAASSSAAAPSGDGVTTNADVFGPACNLLPKGSDKGSLDSMGPLPVASAAASNPLLTKLVAAVMATKLVDPLNSAEKITVFAPADAAFQPLVDSGDFAKLAADPAKLAPILKYHVADKRYDVAGLLAAKSLSNLDSTDGGGNLKIGGTSKDDITVDGAKVLCGNIPTKNATVFVIDKVLTPGTNKN
ncbi:fasciclin domain-containing protein [Amycolatopsis sp. H20-H5]|uniref:fasciclin domain-containing protein n=1 Tax=Amycolatopsis sp. H20-H5 TaxID=3046309 RepID=UPI002DC04F30|nr:fasciclin domain-containing protein [Amycolatopsis sp. H20-H5]MEC3975339.1 fasciclin domain-containing protein [Amycolatopsis sp. H20-H5]